MAVGISGQESFDEYTPRSRLPPTTSGVPNIEPTLRAVPSQQSSRSTSTTRGTLHSHVRPPTSFRQSQLTPLPEQQPTSYWGAQSTSNQRQQITAYRKSNQGSRMPTFRQPNSAVIAATRYAEQPQEIRMTAMLQPDVMVIAETKYANRPQGVQTRIIRPGEPHHFGSRADYERGEVQCTLCRCHNPDSHGDAYTMLNSPRGCDINGQPIDWQEAKRRMLDCYQRDQISHAEEIAVTQFVFDAPTAQIVLQGEEEITASIRQGRAISINTVHNNVGWHNSDGHAKPYLTHEGAKTQYGRFGG